MKILLLAAFSFAFLSAKSQKSSAGFRGGLNFSKLKTTESPDPFAFRTGVNGGFFIQVPVDEKFSLQPELYYSAQGTSIKEDNSIKLNLHYINVPVLAQYKITRHFIVESGLEAGLLLSARGTSSGPSGDVGFRYKDINVAWVTGMRYRIDQSLGVYARYNMGLNNIYALDNLELKNRVLQLGIYVPFKH